MSTLINCLLYKEQIWTGVDGKCPKGDCLIENCQYNKSFNPKPLIGSLIVFN